MRAAHALDEAIALRLARKEENLAADYIAIGRGLVEMQSTRGFKLVEYPTFEGYLKAKPTFGRTYYSYLIKLGRARDLELYLPSGIGGAQLVEYSKATDFPDKIGALIAETWSKLAGLTVRDLATNLNFHISEHSEVYRKPGRDQTVRKRPGIVARISKLLGKLGPDERCRLVDAIDEVLGPYRVGSEATRG